MKAMVIRQFGPPDVMVMEDVPTPEAGPGEVVIEVHAVSVNRTLDVRVRAGKYERPVTLPHVVGVDPSGVIVQVGKDVMTRRVGDRVSTSPNIKPPTANSPPVMLGVQVWGGYAEYVKIPAGLTHLVPAGLEFPAATVVTRHAPIAFHLLRDRVKLQGGEWILVMGASGGLGSAGLQVAKQLGATVIAGAGSDERVASALAFGADFGVNYRAADLTSEVKRLSGGRGVDVVFENVGDTVMFPKAFACLARHGRLITAGSHSGEKVPLDVSQLYINQNIIIGATGYTAADVDLALKSASEGRFKVMIDRILPLSEAPLAHRLIEQNATSGKIILSPKLL